MRQQTKDYIKIVTVAIGELYKMLGSNFDPKSVDFQSAKEASAFYKELTIEIRRILDDMYELTVKRCTDLAEMDQKIIGVSPVTDRLSMADLEVNRIYHEIEFSTKMDASVMTFYTRHLRCVLRMRRRFKMMHRYYKRCDKLIQRLEGNAIKQYFKTAEYEKRGIMEMEL